eukprot:4572718-Pyramimonas_sp.AAC.1
MLSPVRLLEGADPAVACHLGQHRVFDLVLMCSSAPEVAHVPAGNARCACAAGHREGVNQGLQGERCA